MSERTFQRWILIFILVGTLFRIFILFSGENPMDDISGERLEAAIKLHETSFASVTSYYGHGPLHLCLAALTLPISPSDPSLGPRLLSLAFSVLLLWCFARFVALYFDSFTTVLATALAAFYPLHVLYSGFVMAEVPFHALLFACLYTYERYRRDPGRPVRFLILSALCFNALSITRFEGLVFIPLLILGLRQAPRRHLWGFGLGILCAPLWWCWMNWVSTGNPLIFLTGSLEQAHAEIAYIRLQGRGHAYLYSNLWMKLTAWPQLVARGFSWPVVFAGLAGFVVSVVRLPQSRWPALLLGWMWAIFTLKVVTETWLTQDRYALTLGLLLIPFAVEGLRLFARLFIPQIRLIFRQIQLIFVSMAVVFIAFLGAQDALANRPSVSQTVREVGTWLQEHASADDHLLIDRDRWDLYFFEIWSLSQHDIDRFHRVDFKYAGSKRVVSEEELSRSLLQNQPRWLVYWPESFALASLFQFDPPKRRQESFNQWQFRLRFYQGKEEGTGIGPVAVYEIFHP